MSENTHPEHNRPEHGRPSETPPGYDQPAQPAYVAPSYQQPTPPAASPYQEPAAPAGPYPGAPEANSYQANPYQGAPQANPYQANPYQGQQQNMGQGYPQQGYGYVGGEQKSKVAAGILGILLGSLGIHNFYLGKNKIALVQLLVSVVSFGFLAPVMGIWGLVEGILILVGHENYRTDSKGIPLKD